MSFDNKEQLLEAYTYKLKSQDKARKAIDSVVDRMVIDKLIEKYGICRMEQYIQAKKETVIASGMFSIIYARKNEDATDSLESASLAIKTQGRSEDKTN